MSGLNLKAKKKEAVAEMILQAAVRCARSFCLSKDEFSSVTNRLSELYRHVARTL